MHLEQEIGRLLALDPAALAGDRTHAVSVVKQLREQLNEGMIRAAEPDASSSTGWRVNAWVKQGILLGFRIGKLEQQAGAKPWSFFDKETVPVREFTLENNVRIVPGGTSVRDGAFVAPSVIVMPPAYVNIGAYVGSGTLVDSHALVGSCAQVGERVHISAAAQVGGVLEPAGAMPVIIEDDFLLGGNTGVYEGCIVKRRAVLGTGVILTGSTPLYDIVNDRVIRRASENEPLIVPEGAVIVAGARTIAARSEFAEKHGLALYAPIIIKYRDEKTDGRTALESALR
jgi:2,3,4,5-tetrahydropyridine-2,6-dicarboxylate N-succinyltransferase